MRIKEVMSQFELLNTLEEKLDNFTSATDKKCLDNIEQDLLQMFQNHKAIYNQIELAQIDSDKVKKNCEKQWLIKNSQTQHKEFVNFKIKDIENINSKKDFNDFEQIQEKIKTFKETKQKNQIQKLHQEIDKFLKDEYQKRKDHLENYNQSQKEVDEKKIELEKQKQTYSNFQGQIQQLLFLVKRDFQDFIDFQDNEQHQITNTELSSIYQNLNELVDDNKDKIEDLKLYKKQYLSQKQQEQYIQMSFCLNSSYYYYLFFLQRSKLQMIILKSDVFIKDFELNEYMIQNLKKEEYVHQGKLKILYYKKISNLYFSQNLFYEIPKRIHQYNNLMLGLKNYQKDDIDIQKISKKEFFNMISCNKLQKNNDKFESENKPMVAKYPIKILEKQLEFRFHNIQYHLEKQYNLEKWDELFQIEVNNKNKNVKIKIVLQIKNIMNNQQHRIYLISQKNMKNLQKDYQVGYKLKLIEQKINVFLRTNNNKEDMFEKIIKEILDYNQFFMLQDYLSKQKIDNYDFLEEVDSSQARVIYKWQNNKPIKRNKQNCCYQNIQLH